MKASVPDVLEKGRIRETGRLGLHTYPGEWYGRFVVRNPCDPGTMLMLMAAKGDPVDWPFPGPPWDHVSVSVLRDGRNAGRCPTWEEMCRVKDWCFDPEECVVQFHPPRSEYVNVHPFVLHLFRPVGADLPRPPSLTVGVREESKP